jgi:cytochrome c
MAVAQALAVQASSTMPAGQRGARRYKPADEITVKGTVKEVKEYTSPRGRVGTHLMVQTEQGGILDVHLGPASFLKEKQCSFAAGDHVEITGAKAGSGVLLARQAVKDGKVLELRDASGVPMWAGRRGAMGQGQMGPMMGRGQMGQMMGRGAQTASGKPVAAGSEGQKVFEARCAGCHNAQSDAKKAGPGLKGLYHKAKLADGQTANDTTIRSMVENGHDGMPGYSKVLTKDQIDEVIGYLKTL